MGNWSLRGLGGTYRRHHTATGTGVIPFDIYRLKRRWRTSELKNAQLTVLDTQKKNNPHPIQSSKAETQRPQKLSNQQKCRY